MKTIFKGTTLRVVLVHSCVLMLSAGDLEFDDGGNGESRSSCFCQATRFRESEGQMIYVDEGGYNGMVRQSSAKGGWIILPIE